LHSKINDGTTVFLRFPSERLLEEDRLPDLHVDVPVEQ
jgi:hypothetical protein